MAAAARKTVTVLFCDLEDSTPLGESMDPEAMRSLLDRYYRATRAAAERHGGTVEKFIGDAVMAVFGIPLAHEDDALRAVRAAQEMREAAELLGLTPRVGVETGEVVTGDADSGHAFASGPAIVTAERLQKEAGPRGILIGEATYHLVAHAVEAEPLAPLALKGKADEVRAWRLHEVRPHAPALARRLDTPLVGRGAELAALHTELARVEEERACRLVAVLGAAGVGKTRLVREFVLGLGDRARVLSGRCLHYGEGATYWPVVELVRSAGDVRRELDERAAQTLDSLLEGAPAATEEVFWAVRKLLESAAADKPLVVVFEDVEWAEPTFLDLIDYLVGWTSTRPVLLCCLARSELLEARPLWSGGDGRTSALVVKALAEEESRELLAVLAGDADVDEDGAARIIRTAAGNPLFVEELLRMLAEEGSLARVPTSIRAVLAARLDRLDPRERAVLQRAAVVGHEFWWGAVAALAPDEEGLVSCLQSLVRKDLIEPARSTLEGEDAFLFAHLLVCEAAYESLSKEVRADLHRRAAAWLADRTDNELDEVVAAHLERAYRYRSDLGLDDGTRELAHAAVAKLAAAGRRALVAGDASTAQELLGRASALPAAGPAERSHVLRDLAAAVEAAGAVTRAATLLAEALELAQTGADAGAEAYARLAQARLRLVTEPDSAVADAVAEAEWALERFAESRDDAGVAAAWHLVAQAQTCEGSFAGAERSLERGLSHAVPEQRLRAALQSTLVAALCVGPTPVAAALARCRAVAGEAPHSLTLQATVAGYTACLEAMAGRFDVARSLYAMRHEILEELGRGLSLAAGRFFSGSVELLAEDFTAAEHELRSGIDALGRESETGHMSTLAALLAVALLMQRRDAEADEYAELGERTAPRGDVVTAVYCAGARARVLARRGEAAKAARAADLVVERARATDSPNLHGDALLALADVRAAAGDARGAADAADEALRAYNAKGNVVAANIARRRFAELAPATP